jgi:hypothetical protein
MANKYIKMFNIFKHKGNKNYNSIEISLLSSQNGYHQEKKPNLPQKKPTRNVGEDLEKRNLFTLLVRM